jgi:hypothetical protein
MSIKKELLPKPKKITKGKYQLFSRLTIEEQQWIKSVFTSEKYTFAAGKKIIQKTYKISESSCLRWLEYFGINGLNSRKKVGDQTNLYQYFTEKDIAFIKDTYAKQKSRQKAQEIIAKKYNVITRVVRTWANKIGIVGNKDTNAKFEAQISKAKERTIKSKYMLITWGQQSTPAHKQFFKNLLSYKKFLNAELGVIVGRYKNPTSIFKKDEDDNWFDPMIEPYLIDSRQRVHEYVSVLADIKVQPTAITPLTGFEGFEAEVSCIIGHPRVHMDIISALENYNKKQLWTTGACTVANYTDSKAGKKGEFHHTLGFAIIECRGKEFYIRQVTADAEDGNFIDLCFETKNGKTKKITDAVEAYAVGDSHFINIDAKKEKVTRQYILKFKPRYVRLDDVFDGASINPHERLDPITRYHKATTGLTLDKEIEHLKKSLKWYADKDFQVIIPRCNHDIFLDRYILDADWKKDVINARTYVRCAALLMDNQAPKGLIPYFINSWYPHFKTLNEDESFSILGIEMSVHGHRGANGSKGGHTQFKRLSTKMITMHTHTPKRVDGVVTGGTSTPEKQHYMKGPNNHLQADCIITKNGKSQQLIFNNYKFTTLV